MWDSWLVHRFLRAFHCKLPQLRHWPGQHCAGRGQLEEASAAGALQASCSLAPAFFVCGAHFPAPLSRELQRQLADFEYHEGRSRCVTGTRVTGTRRPLTQLGRRSDGDSKAAGEQARTARSNGRRDALGYSAVGSTRGRDRKRGEPQSQNATFATCTSPSQCAHHFTIVHHYAIAVCFLRALGTAHTPCS